MELTDFDDRSWILLGWKFSKRNFWMDFITI